MKLLWLFVVFITLLNLPFNLNFFFFGTIYSQRTMEFGYRIKDLQVLGKPVPMLTLRPNARVCVLPLWTLVFPNPLNNRDLKEEKKENHIIKGSSDN